MSIPGVQLDRPCDDISNQTTLNAIWLDRDETMGVSTDLSRFWLLTFVLQTFWFVDLYLVEVIECVLWSKKIKNGLTGQNIFDDSLGGERGVLPRVLIAGTSTNHKRYVPGVETSLLVVLLLSRKSVLECNQYHKMARSSRRVQTLILSAVLTLLVVLTLVPAGMFPQVSAT